MKCEQCEEYLLSYLDQQLPPEEAAEIAGHLGQCSHCRNELDGLNQLSRNVHNLTIPFRQSIRNIEAGVLRTHESLAEDITVQGFRKFSLFGRRSTLLWSGVASVCVVMLAFLLLRMDHSRRDEMVAWGIEHYTLVDQVHALRGNAGEVRRWFREHHNVEVTPPEKVNYAELVGCKMMEFKSEPAPLLRFDGQQTSAVFILPARFSGAMGRGEVHEFYRDGFHIEMWSEEGGAYMKVSKSL